jgi:hypothetical protein
MKALLLVCLVLLFVSCLARSHGHVMSASVVAAICESSVFEKSQTSLVVFPMI